MLWATNFVHNIYYLVQRCCIKIALHGGGNTMTKHEKPLITTNQFGISSLISYMFDQEMLKESVNLRIVKKNDE